MVRVTVKEIEPEFVDWQGFSRLAGIPVSSLQNKMSEGTLGIKPRYFGAKPLFRVSEILEWLDSLPSEPVVKRGRKRLCDTPIKEKSRSGG